LIESQTETTAPSLIRLRNSISADLGFSDSEKSVWPLSHWRR